MTPQKKKKKKEKEKKSYSCRKGHITRKAVGIRVSVNLFDFSTGSCSDFGEGFMDYNGIKVLPDSLNPRT